MIVYFSDRQMQIMGLASTNLPDGFVIMEDLKTEEIETGVATFTCRIGFDDETRLELESMTNAGNFLLRSHNGENEFYTIIDTEIDTKNKTINIYAEDAGLDLLNEIAGEFEATESKTIEWYVKKYIAGTGFEIGINEEKSAMRKLKWEGEETVTARLASIATQFGGCEISYSFEIDGLTITKKYVNIHKERGKDDGITLRLNQDVDKIITTKSVANLATAFLCEGGVPDKEEKPITFSSKGYTWYDSDNDFYIDGDLLKSRKAIQKWSRQAVKLNKGDGIIVRPYSYNTTDPATLRAHAVTELKKVCDMEVNYEVDISVLPESVKIGDRINIVDDAGELYLSTRLLVLETSVVDQKHSAILGEHVIKTSGISQKVADLAEQFAKTSVSAAQALNVANAANTVAEAAKTQAETAATGSESALNAAEEAKTAAQNANTSAGEANAKADAAQEAVSGVQETVSEMEKVVGAAEQLAESAKASAEIATAQSTEAKAAASNAVTNANEAKEAATKAQASAESAITKSDSAVTQADEAKTNAQEASTIAAAAKLDSEQAKKDVAEFANSLETFESTMSANYARKSDLTETTAALDAKITANANQLSITHSKVLVIDETANDAKKYADIAQKAADAAQETANSATLDAEEAQEKADEAKAASDSAQSEADKAQAASVAAQEIAAQAETDLATAKANLESVKNRADATEEEIAAAQLAVDTAQQAADKAKADATAAILEAEVAQATAEIALTHSINVQAVANKAKADADIAKATADAAGAAQASAEAAQSTANTAQELANTAATNAATAQANANQAAADAAAAQQAANDADSKAAAAQQDLNTAKANLETVTGRVDATEADIAEAERAVATAQQAANDAEAAAKDAQSTANTAKSNAEAAQAEADKAKTAAENAQKAADDAKAAADKAQSDVGDLALRVTSAETEIAKSNEQIALRATKTELDAMVIGGRNLLIGSATGKNWLCDSFNETTHEFIRHNSSTNENFIYCTNLFNLEAGKEYTLSFKAKHNGYLHSFDVYILPITYSTTGIAYQKLFLTATTEYKEYTLTFTPSSSATNLENCQLRIDNNKTTVSGTPAALYIKDIKLEKGIKATDWTPAPEDVDSKFLNYYNKTEMDAELSVMADGIAANASKITDVETQTANLKIESDGIKTSVKSVTDDITANYTRKWVPDTRYSNETPEWYITYYPRQIITEFKDTSVIGLTGEIYGTLTTTVPWGDPSGGYPKQVARICEKEYWRVGTSNTTWSEWKDSLGTAENAQSRVTTCESNITQLDNKITANVTETNALKSRTSTLEQTASSITSRVTAVENAEIGGRNLFSGYGEEEIQLANYQNVGSFSQFYNCLTFNPCETVGEKYTISFWAKSPNGSTQLRIYNSNGNPRHFNFSATLTESLGNAWTHFKLTITNHDLGSSYPDSICNRIEIYAPNQMGVLVKKIKVEKGIKATDWTPAPEDVSDDIDKAQSTADGAKEKILVAESQIQQLAESISFLVRGGGGGSLMKQTADGLYYFDISELEKNLSDTANALNDLDGIVRDANGQIDWLKSAAEALQKRTEYIRSYTDENDNPCLELGEGDSTYKAYITNNGISLMDGSSTPTSVTRQMLVIEKAMVRNELQIGDENDASTTGVWVWKRRANGNLGLSWKGV